MTVNKKQRVLLVPSRPAPAATAVESASSPSGSGTKELPQEAFCGSFGTDNPIPVLVIFGTKSVYPVTKKPPTDNR